MAEEMTDKIITELYERVIDELIIQNDNSTKQLDKTIQENDTEIINIIGEENDKAIDTYIAAEITASERYGFVIGFKYAMSLILADNGKEQGNERPTNGATAMYSNDE